MGYRGCNPAIQTVLGQFRHLGFTLHEIDDHWLTLMKGDEHIAVFSQTGATAESILGACAARVCRPPISLTATARPSGQQAFRTPDF